MMCTPVEWNGMRKYTPLLFTEGRKNKTGSAPVPPLGDSALGKHSLGSGIGADRMIL